MVNRFLRTSSLGDGNGYPLSLQAEVLKTMSRPSKTTQLTLVK